MNGPGERRCRYDAHRSIGYWVVATARALARAMTRELAAEGVTYRQWQVLVHVNMNPEVTQTELARQMEIEPPTLAGILDRMERDGWIERVVDPADRRRNHLLVLDRVDPVWQRMVDCAMRVRRRASRGLKAEDMDRLEAHLATVRQNLSMERA